MVKPQRKAGGRGLHCEVHHSRIMLHVPIIHFEILWPVLAVHGRDPISLSGT